MILTGKSLWRPARPIGAVYVDWWLNFKTLFKHAPLLFLRVVFYTLFSKTEKLAMTMVKDSFKDSDVEVVFVLGQDIMDSNLSLIMVSHSSRSIKTLPKSSVPLNCAMIGHIVRMLIFGIY